MNVISIYNDVMDRTATEQNGTLTITKYNRFSKLAELKCLDYLSGDIEGIKPPEPYSNQKLRDFLTPFIATDTKQVTSGVSIKPDNYYRFDNLKVIGSYLDVNDCGDEVMVSKGDTVIELLDSQQFDKRCLTKIKDLRPSMKKPIAKMVGNTFVYAPVDLGSVKLEYVRYPVYGQVIVEIDAVFNDEIPSPTFSIDYEWGDYARNLLLFFLTQFYPVSTREKALVEQNELVGKSPRG